MPDTDFVIIGSGINSLVAAAMLARRGHGVRVLERSARLGGCIRTEQLTAPGFVHDVLSCWHPLFVVSPGYAELREELEQHGLEYCNTSAPTAAVLPDGRHFVLRRDRAANVAALDALAAGDGQRYQAAMAGLEADLDLTLTLLGSDWWTPATAKALLRATWRRGLKGMSDYFGLAMQSARAWLETDFRSEEARACFGAWPAHAGVGPEQSMSGHMAKVILFTLEMAGCPVVRGGGQRLVEAFRRLIEAHGGALETGVEASRIEVEGGRARGVHTAGGERYGARRGVLASVTPGQLYTRLLEETAVPDEVLHQARGFRHGKADMQIHIAMSEPPRWREPALAEVAMVHVTPGLDGVSLATSQAECGLLPAAGTIVCGQPAALDPSRVPEGKGLLWLQLQELPSLIRGDAAGELPVPEDGSWTEAIRERYADRIVALLGRHVENLESAMIARTVLSPADLEAVNCNLVGGDPYGGAGTMDQSLLWRPLRALKNHDTPVKNLYHIGASTHPGPGLGGGSGWLVASRLA